MPGSLLKAGARKLIMANSPRLLIISLLFVVLSTIVSWLSLRLPGTINIPDMYIRLAAGEIFSPWMIYSNFRPIGVLLAVILRLLLPVLDVGFISYCIKINRNESTEFKDLFNGFLYFWKVIMLSIVITVLVILWSILLIIPGIIASYRYRLSYYILLDDPGKGVFQCISESKRVMRGRKLDLFTIDLSFLGWYVIDFVIFLMIPLSFAIPIVSIWLSPYVGLTRVAFYEFHINSLAV